MGWGTVWQMATARHAAGIKHELQKQTADKLTQAYLEGVRKGWNEGWTAGHREGWHAGWNAGWNAGRVPIIEGNSE